MSVLFPKINRPREWDYRPIYYDPEKEERREKLKRLQGEKQLSEQAQQSKAEPATRLHRGSFREAAGDLQSVRVKEGRKANLRFAVIAALLLIVAALYFFVL